MTDRIPDANADPLALLDFLKSLRTVLETARWSGSARNRQPWEFFVVRDHKTLERLIAPTPAISAVMLIASIG